MGSNAMLAGLQSNPNPNNVLFGSRRAAIQFGPPSPFPSPSPSLIKLQAHYNCASYCASNNNNFVRLASPQGWYGREMHRLEEEELFAKKGLFEGMKAYRKQDDKILLFRPEENALRFRMGAELMCMSSPTVEQFVEAVKLTALANKRWIPPPHKGSLYIRPLLIGSGAVLVLAPAPEYTFLIYVSPVGNYFKEGLAPINLVVETELHRATPGGTGGVKTIGNYAAVLKAQTDAKAKGYSDVLYLDSVHKRYLEEVSSCNIFLVKDNVICTSAIKGTILPGITRKSIIDVAHSQGFQVEERLVTVDELLDADEVFCTGTAVVVSPVGSIRVSYGNDGIGIVARQLYSALTRLQMGLTEDTKDWIVMLKWAF